MGQQPSLALFACLLAACLAMAALAAPPRVHIVTAVQYPQNLHLLVPHIQGATQIWDVTWFVVFATREAVPCNYSHLPFVRVTVAPGSAADRVRHTLALGWPPDVYVYVQRDDTLPHPALFVHPLNRSLIFPQAHLHRPKVALTRHEAFIATVRALQGLSYDADPQGRLAPPFLQALISQGPDEVGTTAAVLGYVGLLVLWCGVRPAAPVCVPPGRGPPRRPAVHIVTPCTRPHYLLLLQPHLEAAVEFWNISWWVVYDRRKVRATAGLHSTQFSINERFNYAADAVGQAHVNFALDQIRDPAAFVYVLDDDTVLHPLLPRTPLRKDGLIFGQFVGRIDAAVATPLWKRRAGQAAYIQKGAVVARVRPARPSYVRPKFIDQGQYLLRRRLIGAVRYQRAVQQADGIFIQTVYRAHPEAFEFVDRGLCYYNALDDWCGMRIHTGGCEAGLISSCYSRTKGHRPHTSSGAH